MAFAQPVARSQPLDVAEPAVSAEGDPDAVSPPAVPDAALPRLPARVREERLPPAVAGVSDSSFSDPTPGRRAVGPCGPLLDTVAALGLPRGPAVRATETDTRRHLDRRPGVEALAGVQRCAHHDVDRGLELSSQRRPDVGEGPVLRGRQRDRDRYRQPELGQRPRQHIGGQRVVLQEAEQQGRQQPVFVLGSLRPGRDEVGQLEVTWWQAPRHDEVGLVVDVVHPALASAQVLADVVQVDVDGGRVAPPGPLPGRGVEDDLDIAHTGGLTFDQRAQRGVHLVDHVSRMPFRDLTEGRARMPIRGHRLVPDRAPDLRGGAPASPKSPAGQDSLPDRAPASRSVPPGPSIRSWRTR